MNDIKKFDPATLASKVKERVKNSFIDLIPDDEWEKFIKREIKHFMDYRYNPKDDTPFQKLIKDELVIFMKLKIKKALATDKFNTLYINEGNVILSQELEDAIIGNAGKMFMGVISSTMNQMIESFKSQLNMY